MSLHKEINFETEICQHLADSGWLYAESQRANDLVQERQSALVSAAVTEQVDDRNHVVV